MMTSLTSFGIISGWVRWPWDLCAELRRSPTAFCLPDPRGWQDAGGQPWKNTLFEEGRARRGLEMRGWEMVVCELEEMLGGGREVDVRLAVVARNLLC